MPRSHRRREPAPGVFRLVLPLPFPGLDRVNAYALRDGDGVTLVDCGIFDPDPAGDHGWDELVAALAACDVAPGDVRRLVVTHPHVDHYGMAARLVERTGCELWMHERASEDVRVYADPRARTESLRAELARHGIDAHDARELTEFEDWRAFVSGVVDATRPVADRDTLEAGGRTWTIHHTPGHSRSHVCLFAAGDGILVSGDHLLGGITPHIDFRPGDDEDPLGDYLRSLERVEELEPGLVLPGHGRPFEDGGARARSIARHHDRRLGSVVQVVRHEPRTASYVTQEIFGPALLNFQRRLALGEAIAHLDYLCRTGDVERGERDGTVFYRKVPRRRSSEDES
ncbi:MAG TPA: MBL fold metallo-hydrolase [Actinomycetota bacterium]|nr:MBL fold metallo-hydrolase [Actinomycetota bacterium]